MLKAVEGIYKNGQIELLEQPDQMAEARVIVTFLMPPGVNLAARGIDEAQAAELRWRLGAMAEDWERPEMDVYDEL